VMAGTDYDAVVGFVQCCRHGSNSPPSLPGFMPGIHVFLTASKQDVDGRDKPGHD